MASVSREEFAKINGTWQPGMMWSMDMVDVPDDVYKAYLERTGQTNTYNYRNLIARNEPSKWFNDEASGTGSASLAYGQNNPFGGLTNPDGFREIVSFFDRQYPQQPQQPAQPENTWTYKANPYTQEQLDRMAREGIYARTPGFWGVDTEGNKVWNPETINNAYGGSFSAEAAVPVYLSDMNALVAAMNHVNNGGTSEYYTNMIDRYKSDPNLLMANANQIDSMIEQARQELASGGRTQWANTILQTYLPEQQAYRQMLEQFNTAFQQWQPNPGHGTSWGQTATPWQGAAQWLEQAQYGNQATGGGNFQDRTIHHADQYGNYGNYGNAGTSNTGFQPYTGYPGNFQPNPQYQTQPYPSGGGTSVGYGQPYQPTQNGMKQAHDNTLSTQPVNHNVGGVNPGVNTTMYAHGGSATPNAFNKNQQVAASLNPNLARYLR